MDTPKKLKKNRNPRAVSPVIATVILVAIAITVSVAVAYWMGGVTGTFTKFEQVEIQSGACEMDTGGLFWNITIKMKNAGDATATLNGVFVSDLEVTDYGASGFTAGEAVTSMTAAETLNSGANVTIQVYIATDYKDLSSGTQINIKIHSAGGMDYIKIIELV